MFEENTTQDMYPRGMTVGKIEYSPDYQSVLPFEGHNPLTLIEREELSKVITIKKSETADSRTATGEVTKDQLIVSSKQHIEDVQKGIQYFRQLLHCIGQRHDYTKLYGIADFYDSFKRGLENKEYNKTTNEKRECTFKLEKWFKEHVTKERHHVNDCCPEDVNLLDLLERIADICMAAKGRSGKDTLVVDELDAEILQRAYRNTIKLLSEQIVVED